MNLFPTLSIIRPAAALPLAAVLLASPAIAFAAPAKEKAPTYDNYVDFAYGTAQQRGDRPGFQKDFQVRKDGYGGIEDLFVTRSIDDATTLTVRGHALAGNNDYLLDLNVTRDEVGFVRFGYQEYRVFYDGTGGYYPPNSFIRQLYDEELAIDRSHLWLEAGYTPEDAVNFVFRYHLFTREGTKDSLSWGDTGLAVNSANLRALLPSFWQIDEKRHQVTANISKATKQHLWNVGLRYDKGDYSNRRNERRRAGEAQDRKVTQKEGQDYDLFQVRGSYENRINEQFWITTAVARTTIDTALSGSRIYGQSYDGAYDPAFLNRQQRDEGFYGLHGDAEMRQTIATLSVFARPTETLILVPSARFEKISWNTVVDFEETNFGGAPAFAPVNDEVEAESNKHWQSQALGLEARYTGFKHWSINAKIEGMREDGELEEERILEPGTPLQAISIDRDTDFDRAAQKYVVTANWYARPGTTVAFQYYFKARQNDYRSTRDNTVSTADRYPAYVANQDFETNDFNVRFSTRLGGNVRSVTRYDFQESTIRTQDIGLQFKQSAEMTSHILAQSLSWNPLPRWYVQSSVNVVWDTFRTPAFTLIGPAANLVKNSDANYINFVLGSGYAIDDRTDLFVDFTSYAATHNFVDNSNVSVPFGSEAKQQYVSLTWMRKLNARTRISWRYAYVNHDDVPYGDKADYSAHQIYGKVQYRF